MTSDAFDQQAAVTTVPIPSAWRARLAHAVCQRLADESGVDLLHVKGPALHPGLAQGRRPSNDADILVRPAHWKALTSAMRSAGWVRVTGFSSAADFGHAANWFHPHWGYADLHRFWPGLTLSPDDAFDRMWQKREVQLIGHWECTVPSVPAQLLILILHAARSRAHPDLARLAGPLAEHRDAVEVLVKELGAEVAYAAGTGELDSVREQPAHDLWHHLSHEEGTRLSLWRARLRAAEGTRAKAVVLASMWSFNRDWLRMELRREPTASDLARHQGHRALNAVQGLTRLWSGWGRR